MLPVSVLESEDSFGASSCHIPPPRGLASVSVRISKKMRGACQIMIYLEE